MKEYKIFTFEEMFDKLGMPEEFWLRVLKLPKAEQIEAARKEITWPEGFLEKLKGKSLEEQMKYYRIVEKEYHSRTAYGEITKQNYHEFGCALEEYPGLMGLIVEDGVLIGACIKAFARSYGTPAYPYIDICTYYASDNNGSGSKDREDYAHLCCVIPE